MSEDEIRKLIDRKIFEHELRVGIGSFILGFILVGGIFHAIWLLAIHTRFT